jgi:hypothetical protein
MLKLVVHDVWAWENPFMGFVSMCISVPREGKRAKVVGEKMWNVLFKS